MMNLIKIILLSILFLSVSCGKNQVSGSTLHIEKGSGKLMLKNASEVLDFRSKLEEADVDERVLMGAAPQEEYILVIEDIERGDYIGLTEAEVNSWLSNEQKEAVKNNNGCLKVAFFDATYFPGNEKKEAYFSPGHIAFQGSWACQ